MSLSKSPLSVSKPLDLSPNLHKPLMRQSLKSKDLFVPNEEEPLTSTIQKMLLKNVMLTKSLMKVNFKKEGSKNSKMM
jgi:hypothetical protein